MQRSFSMLNTCKTSLYSPRIFSLYASNHSLVSLSTLSFSSLSNSFTLKAHKLRAFGTKAAAAQNGSDAYTFLAEDSVSWASLGVSDSISRALCNVGLHRPSLVQVIDFLFCFFLFFFNSVFVFFKWLCLRFLFLGSVSCGFTW